LNEDYELRERILVPSAFPSERRLKENEGSHSSARAGIDEVGVGVVKEIDVGPVGKLAGCDVRYAVSGPLRSKYPQQ